MGHLRLPVEVVEVEGAVERQYVRLMEGVVVVEEEEEVQQNHRLGVAVVAVMEDQRKEVEV